MDSPRPGGTVGAVSGTGQDGQWPGWARWAVLGGLGAIVVVGIVLAAAGGRLEGATLRILIAAVAIPALLTPFQLLGLRRRSDRVRERLHGELGTLEAGLDRERATALPERATDASDTQLTSVSAWVRSTREQVSSDASGAEVAASLDRLGELTSQWPADAPLTREVARCRALGRTLKTTSRRGGTA